jgi:hypothetical protein
MEKKGYEDSTIVIALKIKMIQMIKIIKKSLVKNYN